MLSKKDIRGLEKKYGFAPNKRLGQNFLIDVNIRDKILRCADINKDDIMLEIGSGLGQLTFEFSRLVKKVIAVEFDKKIFSVLSDLAKDRGNIVLAHEDFLKFNIREFAPKNKKIKVVSNIPYYITTPVILKLFAHMDCIESAVLTLQKEVSDRLTAAPATKDYGSITLFTEFHSTINRLFNISRNSFYPAPKVDSTVILLKVRDNPPVDVPDKNDLFEIIRAGFSMRRKTLLNAIAGRKFKNIPKEYLHKALRNAGIPDNARAETLSLADFARIANALNRA